MPPKHRKPGARIQYSDVAARQADDSTTAQTIDVDRALSAIAADPPPSV
ncbi:hypothetical protein [Streptomyces sp. NPDC029674]